LVGLKLNNDAVCLLLNCPNFGGAYIGSGMVIYDPCVIIDPPIPIYKQESETVMIDQKTEDVTLYPNPSSDVVFIKSNNEEPIVRWDIFNQLGHLVVSKNEEAGNLDELNVADLPSGIYICKVYTRSGKSSLQQFLKL
jgi:hypothetical protein